MRDGFHIEYDVVDDRGLHTTEVTDVDRPYRARTVRFAEGRSVGGVAWSERGVYRVTADGATQEVSPTWPGPPGPESHLDLALPVALRQHLVQRAGSSTVLGKPCTQWVSAQPLDGVSFSPAGSGQRTVSCVSDSGLVLRDDWQRDGHLLRARVATAVGPAIELNDRVLFAPTPTPLAKDLAAYSVTESTEAELTRLIPVPDPAPPPGTRIDHAVAVLDIDRSAANRGITREGAVLTWVGGGHLVQAKYGRDLLSPTPAPTGGESVPLGALGSGRLTPLPGGLQVAVLGPKGLLLTVTADLPEDQLLSWMRALSWST